MGEFGTLDRRFLQQLPLELRRSEFSTKRLHIYCRHLFRHEAAEILCPQLNRRGVTFSLPCSCRSSACEGMCNPRIVLAPSGSRLHLFLAVDDFATNVTVRRSPRYQLQQALLRRQAEISGDAALRFPYDLKKMQVELQPDAAFLRLAALVRQKAKLDPHAFATSPHVSPL